MSNKHFRREEERLAKKPFSIATGKSIEDLEDEPVQPITRRVNKFVLMTEELLNGSDNDDDNDADGPVGRKKPKEPESCVKKPAITNKKINKKKKTVKKGSETAKLDDLDNLLFDSPSNPGALLTCDSVVKVDPRALNPDVELYQLLGKVYKSIPKTLVNNRRRSRLVQVKQTWPPLNQIGISMLLDKDVDGIKWYRFSHNKAYQELQQTFWALQQLMDYHGIIETVMAKNPYHLDSLLLLSENLRVQEDTVESIETIARGIYACECAFHFTFQVFSSDCLLSYEWRENRAFFLLLHYYVFSLIQRNCYATALEFTKLIFLKNSIDDPLATLLFIDSVALKARNYQFLISFYNHYKDEKKLDMLPNFLYSLALANFFLSSSSTSKKPVTAGIEDGNDETVLLQKSEDFLEMALTRFPFLLGQILDKLQVKADVAVEKNYLFTTLAFYKEPEGLRLVSDIYLHHTLELWKMPNVLLWLETTTHKVLPRVLASSSLKEWTTRRARCFVGMPKNVLRHAIIYHIRHEDTTGNLTDPCPPEKTFSDYESLDFASVNEMVSSVDRQTAPNVTAELLRSLLPESAQPQLANIGESARNYAENIISGLVERLNNINSSLLSSTVNTETNNQSVNEPSTSTTIYEDGLQSPANEINQSSASLEDDATKTDAGTATTTTLHSDKGNAHTSGDISPPQPPPPSSSPSSSSPSASMNGR